MTLCKICNIKFDTHNQLSNHLKKHKIKVKDYYDKFLKKENDGICKQYTKISTCKKYTKFYSLQKKYNIYCNNIKCIHSDKKLKEKQIESLKKTILSNKDIIIQKREDTCLKRYGVKNINKSNEIKKKKEETCLKRYGVKNPRQSTETKEKIKKLFDNKYNGHPMYNKEIRNKTTNSLNKTLLSNKDIIIQKREDTCLKRYGNKNPSQIEKFKTKREDTCLKRYNVNNFFKLEEQKIKHRLYLNNNKIELQKKREDTCLEKYGVKTISQVPYIKEKIKTYINNNKFELQKKREETCLEKYGVKTSFLESNTKSKIKKSKTFNLIQKMISYFDKLNIKPLINLTIENSSSNIQFECLKCKNIFSISYFNIQQRFSHPCNTCYPISYQTSKPQKEILNFIESILINKEIINNTRKVISPKELDIYIPKLKVAIEFNGLYWHSENKIDNHYHLNKTNLCEEQDIQLIHIFEDEWILKKEIVKSRLQNILNIKCNNIIYARNCIIKEIKPNIKNDFLEENHIQGKDSSSIKLGAFNNNNLISVMTFSKGNISKGSKPKDNVWELNRFCNKLNYHIPGIASKLLSYFKKNYEWIEIFSYADRRWSKGNVYNKLGFELSHITNPNYWYIKDYKRIHRFNLRKRNDEPKDIPEWILRLQEGYNKIWDCGSLKYSILNINK